MNKIIFLPNDYQFIRELKEAEKDTPKGAILFGTQVGETKAILCFHEINKQIAPDFTEPQKVVDQLHASMEDYEGVVEVGCGRTNADNPIIYYIIKQSQRYEGRLGNRYLLHLNLQVEENIYFICGVFEEFGSTGIRDNTVFAKYRQDHPDIKDPFAGWSCDPYDPAFTKGFLMNISEQKRFDRFFSGHPLTQARVYVNYVATNN